MAVERFFGSRKANYRVLLVDDDTKIVEPIAAGLCAEGHMVRSTTHGNELLRLVELMNPEIVVTGVILEEIDTLEVIPALRRSHPHIKIIAISGNPHLLALAAKHGTNHVLRKPFRLQELNLLIRVAMQ